MRYNPISDRFLVVEQKGLRVFLTGLFVAFFMGLTFKAIFSPQRIKYEIEKAIENSNTKQFEVKIDKAYLSLEKEWLPRLAVVIEDLTIQTSDPCLFNASIKVDILTIPVSIRSILDRSLSLKRVEMEKLKAHFQTLGENCPNQHTETNSSAAAAAAHPKAFDSITSVHTNESLGGGTAADLSGNLAKSHAAETPPINNPTAATAAITKTVVAQAAPLVQTLSVEGGSLEEIFLSEGQFFVDTLPGFFVQFKKVKAYLNAQPEKQAQIEGTLELVPLASNRLQGWHTRFLLDAKEDFVKTNIHGNWREGSIQLELSYKPKINDIVVKGSFEQIPLSQLMVMGQNMGWWKEAPSARQSWVTLNMEYLQTPQLAKSLKIQNFKVEGDFGDIHVQELQGGANSSTPSWKWDPLDIQIQNVIIEKLMSVFDLQHPTPALGSLGVFNGVLSVEGAHLKNLLGDIRGLEFIFSNKGKRDIQSVAKLDVSLKEINDQYKYKIENIELKEGSFEGKVEGEWMQPKNQLQMALNVDHLTLNPHVISLMTNRGSLSPLQGKLNVQWAQGELPHVQGAFKIDKGQIEKVDFEKLKWDFESQKNESNWKLAIQNIKWSQNANAFKPLSEILKADTDHFDIKNITLNARKKDDNLDWSDLQAQIPDLKLKIQSQGAWDEEGTLRGVIHVIKSDRSTREVQVSGTRESPVFN